MYDGGGGITIILSPHALQSFPTTLNSIPSHKHLRTDPAQGEGGTPAGAGGPLLLEIV